MSNSLLSPIIITGANGYIGSALDSALLKDGRTVCPINRRYGGDLSDSRQASEYANGLYKSLCDTTPYLRPVLIHCAVIGGNRLVEDSHDVLATNLTMYANVKKYFGAWCDIIHINSGASYTKVNHTTEDIPLSYYGMSKYFIGKDVIAEGNTDLVVYGIFDENELSRRFIKSALTSYICREPIEINGNIAMDFIYMDDFISIVKYAINGKKPLKLHCTYFPNHMYWLEDIATFINSLDEYNVPVIIHDGEEKRYLAGHFEMTCADIAMRDSPFGPSMIGLEEGIRRTYVALKQQIEQIQP